MCAVTTRAPAVESGAGAWQQQHDAAPALDQFFYRMRSERRLLERLHTFPVSKRPEPMEVFIPEYTWGGIFDVVTTVLPELGFRSDRDDKTQEWEGSCEEERTTFVEMTKKQLSLDNAVFFCFQIHDPNDETFMNVVSVVTEDKDMYVYCPEPLARREPLLSLLDLAEEMGCSKVQICIPRATPDSADMIKSFLYFGFSLHPSNLSDFLTLSLPVSCE